EHVARVWPLVPSPPGTEGMARFEWIGTVPDLGPAALPALAMQHRLGPERKAARLRYLASQLRTKLRTAVPGAHFYTTDDPAMRLGVTTVELPGVDVAALQKRLRERDAILVQAMTGLGRSPEIGGIRVTPNVYTAPDELNRFVEAVARG
ncbi:MAG TPA: hypothetical protein VF048_02505, partial [Gemmatimonadaceae bacterium]